MKNRIKQASTALLGILLIVSLAAGCAAPTAEKPAEEKVIKLGTFTCLTGFAAADMTNQFRAFTDYTRYLNEEMGGINGMRAEVVWVDDAYSLPKSITGYKKFKEEGCTIIGTYQTAAELALKETLRKDQMPALSGSGGADQLVPAETSWIYPVCSCLPDDFGRICDWIVDEHWPNWKGSTESRAPRLAHLTWDTPYGKAADTPETRAYAQKVGIELAPTLYVPYAHTDTTVELLKLRDQGVDYVYMNTISSMASVTMKDATRLGLRENMTFITNRAAGDVPLIVMAGEAADGVYVHNSNLVLTEDSPGLSLVKDMQQKFHGEFNPSGIIFYYPLGWAQAATMAETTCPGNPQKGLFCTLAKIVGFPGLIEIP